MGSFSLSHPKPLVLKLVRCLVLINELQIPHPWALSLVTGKNEEPCELEGEAGQWALMPSSSPRRGHCELVSHLPQPLAPHLALAFGNGTSGGTIGKGGGQPRQRAAGKTPSLAWRPARWHLGECVIAFTQRGGGGKVKHEEAEVGWAQGPQVRGQGAEGMRQEFPGRHGRRSPHQAQLSLLALRRLQTD